MRNVASSVASCTMDLQYQFRLVAIPRCTEQTFYNYKTSQVSLLFLPGAPDYICFFSASLYLVNRKLAKRLTL